MAVKYFTGFETGDASELQAGVGAGHSVQSTLKRTGGYAFKSSPTAPVIDNLVIGLNLSTVIVRRYLYIDHKITSGGVTKEAPIDIFATSGGSNIAYTDLILDGADNYLLYVVNAVTSTTLGSGFAVTAGQWYRLEFKCVISATVGVLELIVDGVSAVSASAQNTGATNVDRVAIACYFTDGTVHADLYTDDVLIESASYPGAGACLAFQGKAGAPTYNAFTKTSSQTAAQVWSETPASATNEAHSTAQNQAQTMLVASTANGGATIGASDTINGAQAMIMAKLLAGNNLRSYAVRRRTGGADTDTDISSLLTSSDQLFKAPIFSPSVSDLSTAEIGATRGATTANSKELQVEDAWLMVDYTPAAGRTTHNTRAFPLGMEIGMNRVMGSSGA